MCGDVSTVCDRAAVRCGLGDGRPTGLLQPVAARSRSCVDFVRNLHIPMLVLGGGGYTIKNVSRTWSYETSVLLQKEIDNNIPYNNFIEWYAPTYQLHLIPSNMENKNTQEYLDNLMWG